MKPEILITPEALDAAAHEISAVDYPDYYPDLDRARVVLEAALPHLTAIAPNHLRTIAAARRAAANLLATKLTPEQQQSVVDIMNAMQDLNTLYWSEKGK